MGRKDQDFDVPSGGRKWPRRQIKVVFWIGAFETACCRWSSLEGYIMVPIS